jgi:hypothetical protein
MAERFDRHRAAMATTVAVAIVLLVTATQLLPWLTRKADVVSSTPVRADLASIAPIALSVGQRVCVGEVTLDPQARVAQLILARPAPAGGRLAVETAGGRYRATATAPLAPLQAGRLDVPISPPDEAVLGRLCVRNAGRGTIVLAGTADPRALTRSTIVVDGKRADRAFSLILREAGTRSFLDRIPQFVDRAAALNAVGPWLLWLLVPLLLLGVPAAVVCALHLALREPDPPTRPPQQ